MVQQVAETEQSASSSYNDSGISGSETDTEEPGIKQHKTSSPSTSHQGSPSKARVRRLLELADQSDNSRASTPTRSLRSQLGNSSRESTPTPTSFHSSRNRGAFSDSCSSTPLDFPSTSRGRTTRNRWGRDEEELANGLITENIKQEDSDNGEEGVLQNRNTNKKIKIHKRRSKHTKKQNKRKEEEDREKEDENMEQENEDQDTEDQREGGNRDKEDKRFEDVKIEGKNEEETMKYENEGTQSKDGEKVSEAAICKEVGGGDCVLTVTQHSSNKDCDIQTLEEKTQDIVPLSGSETQSTQNNTACVDRQDRNARSKESKENDRCQSKSEIDGAVKPQVVNECKQGDKEKTQEKMETGYDSMCANYAEQQCGSVTKSGKYKTEKKVLEMKGEGSSQERFLKKENSKSERETAMEVQRSEGKGDLCPSSINTESIEEGRTDTVKLHEHTPESSNADLYEQWDDSKNQSVGMEISESVAMESTGASKEVDTPVATYKHSNVDGPNEMLDSALACDKLNNDANQPDGEKYESKDGMKTEESLSENKTESVHTKESASLNNGDSVSVAASVSNMETVSNVESASVHSSDVTSVSNVDLASVGNSESSENKETISSIGSEKSSLDGGSVKGEVLVKVEPVEAMSEPQELSQKAEVVKAEVTEDGEKTETSEEQSMKTEEEPEPEPEIKVISDYSLFYDKTDKEPTICNTNPLILTNIFKLKIHHLPCLQLRRRPVSQGQLFQIMQKQLFLCACNDVELMYISFAKV